MDKSTIVFIVLASALFLFIWGKWRYDLVALLALLALSAVRIIPPIEAFSGFGHPAVITVAAVLVVSRGLQNSGLVNVLARRMSGMGDKPFFLGASLSGIVAGCSAFMNNVGALAIFMPVTIRLSRKNGHSPSRFLMPLAFSSLLGGMITLIGTPPNIIIATIRAETGAAPLRMFDFAPVGLGVALVGIIFITLVGWRLVPQRQNQAASQELFEIKNYFTEVWVPENSKLAGITLGNISQITEAEVTIVSITHGKRRNLAPSRHDSILAGDTLMIRSSSEDLQDFLEEAGLELTGKGVPGQETRPVLEATLVEAVTLTDSVLEGKTARSANLRKQYGLNLIAVAREGAQLRARLGNVKIKAGDVLLLQGKEKDIHDILAELGCLPLAGRDLRLGTPQRLIMGLLIFATSIIVSAIGLLPVQLAFTLSAVLMVMIGLLSLREAYQSINWPIIILLGAMIPVGQALEDTGGADFIASSMLNLSGSFSPVVALTLVLVGTMFLSDIVNNAAAAVLMAPISIGIASGLGASADPFLIAVAVGASCAFLTPIGHQSNTLVMGPGGYRFSDYWRMGLPLEIIIAMVAIPLILWFWPLGL